MNIKGWVVALAIAVSVTVVGEGAGEWATDHAVSEYTFDRSWLTLRDVPDRWPMPERAETTGVTNATI